MLARRLRELVQKVMGKPLLDQQTIEEIVKELQRILISSDVNVKLVLELSQRVRSKALDEKILKGIEPKEQVVRVIYNELVGIIGEKNELALRPMRIMLVGLYGSGKTTTCAKLAKYFSKKGFKPAMFAGDFDRPAAIEQLKQLGDSLAIKTYSEKDHKSLMAQVGSAKEDILILDTSGRNALEQSLIDELKHYKDSFKPDMTILVISADTGQVAEKQARAFSEGIGLQGVIITRIDGSGKAGGALSACHVANTAVYFVGTGEKINDLEPFDPQKFVSRLLGFPDIESLISKVHEAMQEENIELKEEDIKNLDFDVFLKQLKAARKMGPLGNVLSMMGINDMPEDAVVKSEAEMKKIESIISSMTVKERKNPELFKSKARVLRIAKGAGVTEEDVRSLLNRFKKMEKMVKMFSGDRNMQRKFEQMFKGVKMK